MDAPGRQEAQQGPRRATGQSGPASQARSPPAIQTNDVRARYIQNRLQRQRSARTELPQAASQPGGRQGQPAFQVPLQAPMVTAQQAPRSNPSIGQGRQVQATQDIFQPGSQGTQYPPGLNPYATPYYPGDTYNPGQNPYATPYYPGSLEGTQFNYRRS